MPKTPPHIQKALADLKCYVHDLRQEYVGKFVYIPTGKYKGRVAKVTYIDYVDGGNTPYVCLYVLRKDGTGTLNTDGDSRSYWPWDSIQEQLDLAFEK